MSAEQNPTTPPAGGNAPAEDRMSILERRLAEIQAKAGNAAPDPDRTAIKPADATPVEKPVQGTEPLPAGTPEGSAAAETPAAEHRTTDQPTPSGPANHAPAAGTPEAKAAAETAQHVPDAVSVDGRDRSAPEARAVAHYGEGIASHVEDHPIADQQEPITSTAPALVPDPENELNPPADPSATASEAVRCQGCGVSGRAARRPP